MGRIHIDVPQFPASPQYSTPARGPILERLLRASNPSDLVNHIPVRCAQPQCNTHELTFSIDKILSPDFESRRYTPSQVNRFRQVQSSPNLIDSHSHDYRRSDANPQPDIPTPKLGFRHCGKVQIQFFNNKNITPYSTPDTDSTIPALIKIKNARGEMLYLVKSTLVTMPGKRVKQSPPIAVAPDTTITPSADVQALDLSRKRSVIVNCGSAARDLQADLIGGDSVGGHR